MDSKSKQKSHYLSLHGYTRQIIRFYALPQQLRVYESLLADSKTLNRHYFFYRVLRHFGLGYLVLAFYGFRTAAQYNVSLTAEGDLIAFAASRHQYRGIEYICALSEGAMKPSFISREDNRLKRITNMLRLAARISEPGNARAFIKALKIIKRVDRRQGWVQAINVSSFLFNVFAFSRLLQGGNKVCFTANDFSPAPLAFKYVARRAGLKQMFAMHGQISAAASESVFPRLDYDISFLYGQAALDAYRAAGKPSGQVIFTGFPGESLPIRSVPDQIKTVGICLANYYDTDTHEIIRRIGEIYPDATIFVRCHPRMLRKPDFSDVNIFISRHDTIKDFARDCGFVIAGNTGAQIDLLKLGCPVSHFPALDKLGHDDIGLVADGTVMLFEEEQPLAAHDINRFFGADWVRKFKRYDALYLSSPAERMNLAMGIEQAYKDLLGDNGL